MARAQVADMEEENETAQLSKALELSRQEVDDDMILHSCAEVQVLLAQYDRREVLVPGKGDCQFEAIGYALGESQEKVRLDVAEELRRHKDHYVGIVEGNGSPGERYAAYLQRMERGGQDGLGDHVTLQAASNRFSMGPRPCFIDVANNF